MAPPDKNQQNQKTNLVLQVDAQPSGAPPVALSVSEQAELAQLRITAQRLKEQNEDLREERAEFEVSMKAAVELAKKRAPLPGQVVTGAEAYDGPTVKYRISQPHYCKGELFAAGSIITKPASEKPSSSWTRLGEIEPEAPVEAPKPFERASDKHV